MEVLYIIIFIFWALMGLQAAAPYVSSGSFSHFSLGARAGAILIFVFLGPVIAITNVVNVIIVMIIGDDEDDGYS